MKLARSLLLLSAVVFAVTAIGYLVVPGVMLSVVVVASNGTADFLIRTEGVALLAGAVFLWAARSGPPGLIRVVLAGLGIYIRPRIACRPRCLRRGARWRGVGAERGIRILLGVLSFVAVARITAADRAGELRPR